MESEKKKESQLLMTEAETYNFHYETFCQDDYYDYYDYYDEEVRAMESEDDREPKMLMTENETDNFHYDTFCQQDFYDYYDYHDEEVRSNFTGPLQINTRTVFLK